MYGLKSAAFLIVLKKGFLSAFIIKKCKQIIWKYSQRKYFSINKKVSLIKPSLKNKIDVDPPWIVRRSLLKDYFILFKHNSFHNVTLLWGLYKEKYIFLNRLACFSLIWIVENVKITVHYTWYLPCINERAAVLDQFR